VKLPDLFGDQLDERFRTMLPGMLRSVFSGIIAGCLMVALVGCGGKAERSGNDERLVELEGRLSKVLTLDGHADWILTVPGEGMLALKLEVEPPIHARGVIAVVPSEVELPVDEAHIVSALAEYSANTGEALVVVGFLD
jgi:hypothetical protein